MPVTDRKLARVLVVDDQRAQKRVGFRRVWQDPPGPSKLLLEKNGFDTRTAQDGPSALDEAEAFCPTLLFSTSGSPK
jgi:CheY-like chemotaxis protein